MSPTVGIKEDDTIIVDLPASTESINTGDRNNQECESSVSEYISCTDAMQSLKIRKDIRKNWISLPKPILFFALFIWCVLDHNPPQDLFIVDNSLKNTLITSGTDLINTDTTMKLDNVATISDVFDWFSNTLIPSVFVTTDYNGNDLQDNKFGRVALYNRVLGAVELLITNAEREKCNVNPALDLIYSECYRLDEINVKSLYLDSDLNATEAQAIIARGKKSLNLISEKTVHLEVTIPVYNGEIRVFGVTKINIEFERGGFLRIVNTISSVPAHPYERSISFVIDIVFLTFFVVMSLLEFREMFVAIKDKAFKKYIYDFWNGVDLLTITVICSTYGLWLGIVSDVYNPMFTNDLGQLTGKGNDLVNNVNAKKRLGNVVARLKTMADHMVAFRMASMFTCLLLAMRILKHFRFQPRLSVLTNTVAKSLNDFGPFLFVFMVLYSAFVVSGCLLFGDAIDDFSSFGRSAVACVNILFGNFDFETIEEVNYATAVIFYWSYMIVIFLVLLNMMLAIVLDAYAEVKSSNNGAHRPIFKEIKCLIFEDMQYVKSKLHGSSSINPERINNEKLEAEIESGSLKESKIITDRQLMNLFNVRSEISKETIRDLKRFIPQNDNDVDDEESRLNVLQTKIQKLEGKLDLMVSKLVKN